MYIELKLLHTAASLGTTGPQPPTPKSKDENAEDAASQLGQNQEYIPEYALLSSS